MAKRSTATRQTNAARRPQTNAKATAVKLVRPDGSAAPVSAGTSVLTRPTQSAPARPASVARPATRPAAPRPAAPKPTASATPAPKPTASGAPASAAPATASTMSAAARAQLTRAEGAKVSRARELQRARAANLITPEHYSYVKNDLRLIGVLASLMFIVVIVLHFVLG